MNATVATRLLRQRTTTTTMAMRTFATSDWHGTTILCIRKNSQVCMIGDGQVSMGNMVVKPNAKKIRKIEAKKKGDGVIVTGFAGSTADAFTLLERLG